MSTEMPSDGSMPDLVLARDFKAPQSLVFDAWTRPEHLANWWGPKGMPLEVLELDLRPGGRFHYAIRPPNGQPMWGRFIYEEIGRPARLVFISSFADAAGNAVRAPFSASWPLEVHNTLLLTEAGDMTTLTMCGVPTNANEAERRTFVAGHASIRQGFAATFDQLADYLALA